LKPWHNLPRLWFTGLAAATVIALGALAFGGAPAQADTTPVVTAISPTAGPLMGGTTVTVTGSGFTDATAVDFGVTAAAGFSVDSDTQITATSPAVAAGTVDVTVTGPDGTSATSAADQFTYAAAPSVTGISPGYGSPAGGTAVTISGSAFTGASEVQFGTADAVFTVVSDSQITATTPPGSGAAPVTVIAPGGTASGQFVYTPIEHVVVIDMENHSFDSLLGFWCDRHPARCPDGGMPASVTLSNGAVVTPGTSPDIVPVVRHEAIDQTHAIDGGKMDGWQRISGCGPPQYACVAGYQPWQIPNVSLLARDFAISDMTFSMADSPSFFGHIYAVAASTDGFGGPTGSNPSKATGVKAGVGWGCDSDKVVQWTSGGVTRVVPSCVPDPSLTSSGAPLLNGGAFEPTPVPYAPTIMDLLNEAGLTWRLYGAQCGNEVVGANGLQMCTRATPQAQGYGWSICPSFAELLYAGQCGGVNGHGDGSVANPQFITDASTGNLPSFGVVTPGNDKNSQHNGFSMAQGDNWLGQQVSAVMNGPEWDSTAIFITWDDCGCFYDNVPPGVNPDGTPQGPRLPMLIVSPWVRPGYTDTTATTLAGVLAFTEQNFGLPPLSANDAGAYSFTNTFNYSQTPLARADMVNRPLPKGDHIDWAQARQDS
jgi:phospholipase C